MTRIRQQNVTAAQWSSNGEALGTVDLTEDKNNPFGVNVFSGAVQKDRLSKDTYKQLQSTLETGESLDTEPVVDLGQLRRPLVEDLLFSIGRQIEGCDTFADERSEVRHSRVPPPA